MTRRRGQRFERARGLLVGCLLLAACSSGDPGFDLDGEISPVPTTDGKDDGVGQPAIAVDADVSDTEVWKVRNQWADTSTPEARAAGLAWPERSGLSWDQKYSAWVASMKKVQAADTGGGAFDTYEIVTPYGTTIPSPALECAETAMFLRATFASWYGLPFFMEAHDKQSGRVFFGHFGVRTAAGRWRNSPLYAQYKDYTRSWKTGDAWPTDTKLQRVHLDGGALANADDVQDALGADVHLGGYLDRLFLNKRAGYFVAYLLDYFFSGNLADAVNTYNLTPTAMREGDFFLHRTDRSGIGHTLVVKRVVPYGSNQILVELVAGSMPRVQGIWADPEPSKEDIVDDDGGGVGDSSDEPVVPLWKLGGGLKRWRAAQAIGGFWVNGILPTDKSNFISSTDGARLGARPQFFQTYIGELPLTERLAAVVKVITDSRAALMRNPSSCALRSAREAAFDKLIGMADELDTTAEALERQYRTIADGVFTPLAYPLSKTCCWDHSSARMAKIVMDYAVEEQAAVQSTMMCKSPTIFAANAIVPPGYTGPIDGYQLWRDWAAKKGRSDEWVDSDGKPALWRQDEPCQGAAATEDTISEAAGDYCEILTAYADAQDSDGQPAPVAGGGPPDMGP